MTWNKGISLELANRIFGVGGWVISHNSEDGFYEATRGSVTHRNASVTKLCEKLVEKYMGEN